MGQDIPFAIGCLLSGSVDMGREKCIVFHPVNLTYKEAGYEWVS
jgi:hypothetical protein